MMFDKAMEHPLDLLRDYIAIATGAPGSRTGKQKRCVTLLDVAQARGAREVDGSIVASEVETVGVPIVAGRHGCGATAKADTAYPTTSGHIECGACFAQSGAAFVSVADCEAWAREHA